MCRKIESEVVNAMKSRVGFLKGHLTGLARVVSPPPSFWSSATTFNSIYY